MLAGNNKRLWELMSATYLPAILGYGFGLAPGQSRSAATPAILQNVMGDFLKPYHHAWTAIDVPSSYQPRLTRRYNVNYHPQVKEAVHNLGVGVAKEQLADRVPVTVGGDHSQGFSTIKATILTQVLKAIATGAIQLHASQDEISKIKEDLIAKIHAGDMDGLGEKIENL